ncbi:MAG: hypothetical protein JNM76_16550 [Betaproteobacteria bacterium]|nr:hypothetical protein [Betaproteobacteria bacterium]
MTLRDRLFRLLTLGWPWLSLAVSVASLAMLAGRHPADPESGWNLRSVAAPMAAEVQVNDGARQPVARSACGAAHRV